MRNHNSLQLPSFQGNGFQEFLSVGSWKSQHLTREQKIERERELVVLVVLLLPGFSRLRALDCNSQLYASICHWVRAQMIESLQRSNWI